MKKVLFYLLLLTAILLSGCTQTVSLFNGKNLDNWNTYLKDEKTAPSEVWSIHDGVIRCEGKPFGYLRTKQAYSNYTLHVEWRWVDKPTNSGVFLHANGEDKLWPQCIEAQLMHQHAGDFITVQDGSAITVNGQRYASNSDTLPRLAPKQHESSEHAPGEWNSYDIVCKDDTITLTVNGVLQNKATQTSLTHGNICLQSEGSPIEFRNVKLTPLK